MLPRAEAVSSSLKITTSKRPAKLNHTLCTNSPFCSTLFRQGGLGEAVLSTVAGQRNVVVKHLGVEEIPRSGPPTVLIDMFGISARCVVAAVNDILKL